MALRFLLDEHLRGPLWNAIRRHNANGVDVINAQRVGDAPAPPLGTPDPELIQWSELHGCVIVSDDRGTMPGHLADHLLAGRHSPGIFLLRPAASISQIIAALLLYDQAADPQDLVDRVVYIP